MNLFSSSTSLHLLLLAGLLTFFACKGTAPCELDPYGPDCETRGPECITDATTFAEVISSAGNVEPVQDMEEITPKDRLIA